MSAFGGRLPRERLAHPLTRPVHAVPVELRVGTRDVDELEEAELRSGLREADRTHARRVDRDELTGLDVADVVRVDEVERGRLAREHPAAFGLSDHERAEPVLVAHTEEVRFVHQHERERTREPRQDLHQRVLEIAAVGAELVVVLAHEQLADQLAVGGEHARQHPEVVRELLGVREVAVVTEREPGVGDGAVDRLRVAPRARTGRGVTDVADREMAVERREPALVEHLGDEAHVLDDRDRLAVAHGDAGRLLTAVLQRVQTEIGHMGDGTARRVHAEHSARVFGARKFRVQGHQYPMRLRRSPVQRRGTHRASRSLPSRGTARVLSLVHRLLRGRQEHGREHRGRRVAGPRAQRRAARRRRGPRAPHQGPRVLEGRPGRERPPHRLGRHGPGPQRRRVGHGRHLAVPGDPGRDPGDDRQLRRDPRRDARSRSARPGT